MKSIRKKFLKVSVFTFMISLFCFTEACKNHTENETFYSIIAKHSNKAIGINPELSVIQWEYLGLDRQQWLIEPVGDGFVKIVSAKNGLCIESVNDSVPGGNIRTVEYSGELWQQWRIKQHSNGYAAFINRFNNLALDIMEAAKDNGWILLTWEFEENDNQFFKIDTISENKIKLTAMHSGKVITQMPDIKEEGANASQWEYKGQPWQHWKIIEAKGDWYKIINRFSGHALQPSNEKNTGFINIEQGALSNEDRQLWRMQMIEGENIYQFINKSSGKSLDILACGMVNGTNIFSFEFNGGSNQLFIVKEAN